MARMIAEQIKPEAAVAPETVAAIRTLREAISASGRSMRDISLSLGWSESHVAIVLSGKHETSIKKLAQIAHEIGLSTTVSFR